MRRSYTAALSGSIIIFVLACSAPMLVTPTPIPTDTPLPTLTPVPPTPTATPTATPEPVVISSGTLDLPQTYMADLDSGSIPRDPKSPAYGDVDIWFDAITNTERYLEPYNGAAMMVMGGTQVGFNECRNMPASVARADVNALPPGTYICISTNIKNTSVVRVNSISSSWPGSIRLEYMTWHQP